MKVRFEYALIAMLLLGSAVAVAQTAPPSYDPRTVAQSLQALQALLTLREAELQAAAQDRAKREAEWMAYAKPLYDHPASTRATK